MVLYGRRNPNWFVGAVAIEPCPIATELVALAATAAPAPIAVPLFASTVALCPTATEFGVVALAELPSAVDDETLAVQLAHVAVAKSPNAAPPFESDALLPTAIEPVAIAPVPIAIVLAPLRPRGLGPLDFKYRTTFGGFNQARA